MASIIQLQVKLHEAAADSGAGSAAVVGVKAVVGVPKVCLVLSSVVHYGSSAVLWKPRPQRMLPLVYLTSVRTLFSL